MQCAIERLGRLTDIAKALDLQLLLENEKGIVGDLPENCLKLMTAIDSPNFRFIWDPANFVQCGAAQHVDAWWDALHPYHRLYPYQGRASTRGLLDRRRSEALCRDGCRRG